MNEKLDIRFTQHIINGQSTVAPINETDRDRIISDLNKAYFSLIPEFKKANCYILIHVDKDGVPSGAQYVNCPQALWDAMDKINNPE